MALSTLRALAAQPPAAGPVFLEHRHDLPGIPAAATARPVDLPLDQLRGPGGPRLFQRQVNLTLDGLDTLGDAANEPSLAIDPTAPNRMIITWRQFDTIASDFRQAGYAVSIDGGRTWSRHTLDPGVFRTDPVIRFDADGTLFWDSLYVSPQETYRCDVFRSFNAGQSWSSPIFAYGGDKSWIAIDRNPPGSPGRGQIYQAWNIAGNPTPGSTFNRSLDHALTWSPPRSIQSSPCFGQVAVGPAGQVYVSGVPNAITTSTFYFARSLNASDPAALSTFTTSTVAMGGAFWINAGLAFPNPGGLIGQVNLCVDTSTGPRRGWIYMLATVDPSGPDPADIKLVRSTDGGQTWSAPIRVNTDPQVAGAWQWMGTMSISPSGRLDVVWIDTRESHQPNLGRLYYRSSSDGGDTWTPEVILGPVWDSWIGWPNQEKIGDYYDMESDDVGASLAFAATYTGGQDVYYLRIGEDDCNRNGVADSVDIAIGTERDCNGNGIPDSCELAAGTLVLPDRDGDGILTPADIALFVNTWFADLSSGTLVADVDRDLVITPADIAAFVRAWAAGVSGGC